MLISTPGAESQSSFLARNKESPRTDTRAASVSDLKSRYYVNRFLQKGEVGGKISDVLAVILPGKA